MDNILRVNLHHRSLGVGRSSLVCCTKRPSAAGFAVVVDLVYVSPTVGVEGRAEPVGAGVGPREEIEEAELAVEGGRRRRERAGRGLLGAQGATRPWKR